MLIALDIATVTSLLGWVSMTFYLLISVATFAPAPAVPRLSFRPVRTRTAPPVAADADAEAKILKLEAELKRLKAEAVEAELKALKAEAGMSAATTPAATPIREVVREAMAAAEERAAAAPPPPPPSPPPSEAPLLPSPEELGVDGQLCALVFYAEDGNNPKLEELLDAFEDEAAELAACGCALVGVRKAEETEKACGKEAEYKERFPSFNFVGGLEKLVEQRVALGLPREWGVLEERELYYDPVVVLLTAEGRMQYTVSHAGLRAPYMVGNLMRELHGLVPTGAQQLSRAEEEAVRVAAYDENAAWAKARGLISATSMPEHGIDLAQATCSNRCSRRTSRCASRLAPGSTRRRGPARGRCLLAWMPLRCQRRSTSTWRRSSAGRRRRRRRRARINGVRRATSLSVAEPCSVLTQAPLYSKDGVKAPAWFARAKRLSEAGLNPKDSGGVYRLLFTPRGVNRPSRPRSGSGGTARRRPRRPARSLSGRRGSGWRAMRQAGQSGASASRKCLGPFPVGTDARVGPEGAGRRRGTSRVHDTSATRPRDTPLRRLPRRARASASCSAACCRRSMTSSARCSEM